MYHHYDVVVSSQTGVPLQGISIRAYNVTDSSLEPLFADESGTPIETVSGIPETALSDGDGNYDFYIDDGFYDLRFFQGEALLKIIDNVDMSAELTRDELAEPGAAALIGSTGPSNVQADLDARAKKSGDTFTGDVAAPRYFISDALNVWFGHNSGNGLVNFDSNDFLTYDKGSNKFIFVIGGNAVASLDGAGTFRVTGSLIPNTSP